MVLVRSVLTTVAVLVAMPGVAAACCRGSRRVAADEGRRGGARGEQRHAHDGGPRGAVRGQPSLPGSPASTPDLGVDLRRAGLPGVLPDGALLAAAGISLADMPNPWPGVYGDRAVGSVMFGRPCARRHSAARTPACTSCGGASGSRIGLRFAVAMSAAQACCTAFATDCETSWKLRLSV